MSKIGELYVSITGDNSDLKSALNDSSKDVESFGSKIGKQVAGIVSVTAILAGAIKGIEFNKAAEQAQVAFTVMTGSAAKATKTLKELKDFANKTPLEFKDLRQSTQTLIQFGVSAEDAVKTIKMLGDVSGGNAEKLQSLALAFGKVSAQGRVTGENVMMMIDAGFNPLKEISDRTGESMQSLQKRMEAGKLSSNELTESFKAATSQGGMFNGMLEKQGQTLAGAQSTFNDAVDTFFGEAMAGASGPLTKMFQDLSKLLADITPAVKDIGTVFGQQLGFIVEIIKPIAELIKAMPSGLVAIGVELGVVAVAAKAVGASFGPWGIALTVAVGLLAQIPSLLKAASDAIDPEVVNRYGIAWFDATKSLKENQKEFDKLRATYQGFQKTIKELDARRAKGIEITQAQENAYNKAKEGVEQLSESSKKYVELLKKQADEEKKIADEAKKGTSDKRAKDLAKEAEELQRISDEKKKQQEIAQGLASTTMDSDEAYRIQYVENQKKVRKETKETFNVVASLQSLSNTNTGNFLGDFLAKTASVLGDALQIYKDFDEKTVESNAKATEQLKKSVAGYGAAIGSVLKGLIDQDNKANSAMVESKRKALEDEAKIEKEAQDAKTDAALEQAEIDYQAALYAAGLTDAVTQEQLQSELDAAIAAGDTETAEKARQEMEKLAIDEQYAASKKAIDDQAAIDTAKRDRDLAYKKAVIEYNAAQKSYENSLAQIAIDTAVASIKVWTGTGTYIEKIIEQVAVLGIGAAAALSAGAKKPTAPAYAFGTDYHPGGMAMVGEIGREMVQLPQGSKVFTNSETNSILNNQKSISTVNNFYSPIDLTPADMERKIRRNDQAMRMQFA